MPSNVIEISLLELAEPELVGSASDSVLPLLIAGTLCLVWFCHQNLLGDGLFCSLCLSSLERGGDCLNRRMASAIVELLEVMALTTQERERERVLKSNLAILAILAKDRCWTEEPVKEKKVKDKIGAKERNTRRTPFQFASYYRKQKDNGEV